MRTIQETDSGSEDVVSLSEDAHVCDRENCYEEFREEWMIEVDAGGYSEYWCPVCVEAEFGIDSATVDSGMDISERYITTEILVVFILTSAFISLIFSILVV